MADLREILTDWVHPSGRAGVTVLYFNATAASATAQRAAWGALLTAVQGTLATGVTATVRTSGREIDDATGTLTGLWAEGTAKGGAGSATGSAVPNVAMGLIRLNTAAIINGRLLKGRVFIPGMSTQTDGLGQVTTSAQGTFNTALATFLASAAPPVVWHRPKGITPGLSATVTTATLWNEYAVLRRRR